MHNGLLHTNDVEIDGAVVACFYFSLITGGHLRHSRQSTSPVVHLPFSWVLSCDEGSEVWAAETSLFSSFEQSPFGGLWKHHTARPWWRNQAEQGSGFSFWLCCTYQHSFWHVLPENKLGLAGCTVCGIFWTEGAAAKRNKQNINKRGMINSNIESKEKNASSPWGGDVL